MDSKKKVILITEDETIQARNGEQGLHLALEKHPDLVILDLLMPEMDGLTMIKKLREDEWGKNVPVIILTNVNPDTNSTLQAIVANQPAYYFVKSDIKLDHLVEKVNEVLTPHPKE